MTRFITTFTYCLFAALLLAACKKNIQTVTVEVEKKQSWKDLASFTGIQKIFLSSGASPDALYFQQPYFFTALSNQNPSTGITSFAAGLPTDVDIRVPISSNFTAVPYSDSVLRVMPNSEPTTSPSGGYFNLKQIAPTLTAIQKYYNAMFKSMAINNNGVVLLSYLNNRPEQPLTLMLLKINATRNYPYTDTFYTKTVAIPRLSASAYVRQIAAIDNYFLIQISGNGLYKVREDGSYSKVYSPATVDAIFKWKAKVYALVEWDRILISNDDGENWQESNFNNAVMTTSSYHVIKDSLVGAYRDNLFTLTWTNTGYTQRFLKADGLENTRINGVEILRDSVYVATTSGLFAKPVSSFFENK